MALSFDILTIFPGMFAGVVGESIVARAVQSRLVDIQLTDIRDFTTDRHRSVDDRPYGGGPGMVFKPEPVVAAAEAVLARNKAPAESTRKIHLTPQGKRLTQSDLREFSEAEWLVILSGHYEGMDERIQQLLQFEEYSIGDYVLSGGEIPSMVILDGVVRLLPGALGHPDSALEESFENGLLDYPQYTRPPEFRGLQVPEILVSGNHKLIEEWRRERALERTRERRSDLVDGRAPRSDPSRPRENDETEGAVEGITKAANGIEMARIRAEREWCPLRHDRSHSDRGASQ